MFCWLSNGAGFVLLFLIAMDVYAVDADYAVGVFGEFFDVAGNDVAKPNVVIV